MSKSNLTGKTVYQKHPPLMLYNFEEWTYKDSLKNSELSGRKLWKKFCWQLQLSSNIKQ